MTGARRLGTALVLVALWPAACTRVSTTVTASPSSSPSPPPASAMPSVAPELPGSLLILDDTGSLLTTRPDGSDRVFLAVGSPGTLDVTHAAWSPDGTRVAWAQIDARDGAQAPRVVTSAPGGGTYGQTEVPFVPFYLSWDPTSSRVAFLGNRGQGIGLGVVDGADGQAPAARSLDRGSPYYFAWAPSGDRLLVHVGDDRLEELDLRGVVDTVDTQPGVFQAPAWTPDGSTQLYVRRGAGLSQRIVALQRGDERSREVTEVEGAAFLVVSPDGGEVAFQALGPDELDLYDRSLPERATDVGVRIVDLETGRRREVSDQVAAAWYWSPDGSRLAILEPVYDGDGPIVFRWRVWDGAHAFVTPTFVPSLALLQGTTPYFSQYAQSWSMWSPDGAAFAFPVDLPGAANTIVIQPSTPDATPYAIGRGTFVAWSPT